MPNTKNTEAKTVISFEAALALYGAQSPADFLARGDRTKLKRVQAPETGFARKKREKKEMMVQLPTELQKLNTNENRGFEGLSKLGVQVTLVASRLENLASAPGCGKSKASPSQKKAQKKVEASKASSPKKRRRRNRK